MLQQFSDIFRSKDPIFASQIKGALTPTLGTPASARSICPRSRRESWSGAAPLASAGIGSQKNICHNTQVAGQAFTTCPAAFSARILKNVFFVYGGASVEPPQTRKTLSIRAEKAAGQAVKACPAVRIYGRYSSVTRYRLMPKELLRSTISGGILGRYFLLKLVSPK